MAMGILTWRSPTLFCPRSTCILEVAMARSSRHSFGASTYPFSVSVVDLNADRLPEIITANGFDSSVAVLLNTTGADFSISASALTPGSVKRGQSATSTLTFAHLNALGDAVTLSCSVQPVQSAPTCSLSPRSVTSDPNGQATATLTINTSTASALNSFSVSPDSRALHFVLWLPVVCFALVGTSLVSRKSAEKGLAGLLIGGLIVGVLIFQVACGGVNNSGPHSTTYNITVTGKSGSTQRSTTVTLAVQ